MLKLLIKNVPFPGEMFAHNPPTEVFEGDLIPNPEWVADDCITITSNDKYLPFRIIKIADIVSGLDIEQPKPVLDQVWEVIGSKGDHYHVSLSNNIWYCTCAGYQYRGDCRHIREKKNELQSA